VLEEKGCGRLGISMQKYMAAVGNAGILRQTQNRPVE
jgi:hypothetical protein